MSRRGGPAPALLTRAAARPAGAQVTEATDSGLTVVHVRIVAADPEAV